MSVSPVATSTLAGLSAAALDVEVSQLANQLATLQEAPIGEWSRRFATSPRAGTLASAVLASGAVPGLVSPRLLGQATRTVPYRHLVERAQHHFGHLGPIIEILVGVAQRVPWVGDLDAICDVLSLVDTGVGHVTRLRVVESLIPTSATIETAAGSWTAEEAARRVLERDGVDFAAELLEAGALPPFLEDLCRIFGNSGAMSVKPVLKLATLPAPLGALVAYLPEYLGRNPASWASVGPLFTHLSRLGEVMELVDPPSLNPAPSSLGRLRVDAEVADAYDRLLIDEVADAEDADLDSAVRRTMAGFGSFTGLLALGAERGVWVKVVPRGLRGHWKTGRYQGVRPDLTPTPATYRRWLAELPALIASVPVGLARLALLDAVTPGRPHVVLSLEQRAWVEEEEGVVLHVRPEALHKRGRGQVFLVGSFQRLYGIERQWLPVETPPVPTPALLSAFNEAVSDAKVRFARQTGLELPGGHYASRRGLVQLLRQQLRYPDMAFASAYLDHAALATLSNYLRALSGEPEAAYGQLARDRRHG